jgi:outer membrane protein OmpU
MRNAMKKILFASTALATLVVGGAASAEIVLFGNARLGLGYNINNEGGVDRPGVDDTSTSDNKTRTVEVEVVDPVTGEITTVEQEVVTEVGSTEDFRAVSRIRFGVTMTGETESGITFGASIRADNASAGGTGASASTGQTAGEVFVSGAWGTLTFGDTDGADEQHVGDAGGNLSVTNLGDLNETAYISNGGGFGDDRINFASNPEARPTVRYDYNFAGFGVSVSTNRNLNDVGVGGSYTYEFAEGSVTGAVGYYDFQEFDTRVAGTDEFVEVKGGEQWSAGLNGTFSGFQAGVVYTAASSDGSDAVAGDLDILNVGLGYEMDAWSFAAWYAKVLTGNGNLEAYDGQDTYGLTVAYDLGGGASVNFGVAQSYGRGSIGTPGDVDYIPAFEDATIGDFGIKMEF